MGEYGLPHQRARWFAMTGSAGFQNLRCPYYTPQKRNVNRRKISRLTIEQSPRSAEHCSASSCVRFAEQAKLGASHAARVSGCSALRVAKAGDGRSPLRGGRASARNGGPLPSSASRGIGGRHLPLWGRQERGRRSVAPTGWASPRDSGGQAPSQSASSSSARPPGLTRERASFTGTHSQPSTSALGRASSSAATARKFSIRVSEGA